MRHQAVDAIVFADEVARRRPGGNTSSNGRLTYPTPEGSQCRACVIEECLDFRDLPRAGAEFGRPGHAPHLTGQARESLPGHRASQQTTSHPRISEHLLNLHHVRLPT
jgi:hypothetical protein